MVKKKETPKRDKPKKISMKRAYDEGILGKMLPGPKPKEINMADWVKSCLSMVNPQTGIAVGDFIIQKQAELAMKGDKGSAEFLFDRAYGKPIQTVVNQEAPKIEISHNTIRIDEAK